MDHRKKPPAGWVPETRIGTWFQSTGIWRQYVLAPALDALFELVGGEPAPRRILDVGCGEGPALPILRDRFGPDVLVGVDIDPHMIRRAEPRAREAGATIRVADASKLDLPDASFDWVLCHQTLHHVSDQEAALCELFRILAPGGVLLISESCRRFIAKAWVRLFFRHPMECQRSPDAYVEMVRRVGFRVDPGKIRHPTPGWAGGARTTRRSPDAEPNQLLLVASRPR
jgi:ubiquinone/menaquinone biosynthesis C-methylase UbiE